MSESDIIKIYNEGIQSVVTLVQGLSSQITDLSATVENQNKMIEKQNETISDLDARLKALENQTKLTSKNSSLPPSTDGFKKTKSLRQPSKKNVGGQIGHKGSTLKMVQTPDHVCVHDVEICSDCGQSLHNVTPLNTVCRQVFDLPKLSLQVTEHRVWVKVCPFCQTKNKADFPQGITQPTQYGSRFKSILVYLSQQHLIPYARLSEITSDLFGQQVSLGTLVNFNRNCYEQLEATERVIKQSLIDSSVAHFDETGCYVDNSRKWLHVVSNQGYTYYQVHDKRGNIALKAIDVLAQFKGTAIHDHWKSYFKYSDCSHALCNVHHLRELNAVIEFENQEWAKQMKELLLEMKAYSEAVKYPLPPKKLLEFEARYQEILTLATQENPIETPVEVKRGRQKLTKTQNLIKRLCDYQEETLEFLYQKDVPFDNNLAERDVRMTKVKQKISGCFRSHEGAEIFCRIRGYISTMRKQRQNILEAIETSFSAQSVLV